MNLTRLTVGRALAAGLIAVLAGGAVPVWAEPAGSARALTRARPTVLADAVSVAARQQSAGLTRRAPATRRRSCGTRIALGGAIGFGAGIGFATAFLAGVGSDHAESVLKESAALGAGLGALIAVAACTK